MATITLKQGEGKTLQFTADDDNGNAVDISTATMTFTVKKSKSSSTIIIQKDHADFDMTDAAIGIAKVPLSETDTDIAPYTYTGELKIFFNVNSVEKSKDIVFIIEKSIN